MNMNSNFLMISTRCILALAPHYTAYPTLPRLSRPNRPNRPAASPRAGGLNPPARPPAGYRRATETTGCTSIDVMGLSRLETRTVAQVMTNRHATHYENIIFTAVASQNTIQSRVLLLKCSPLPRTPFP